jgi:hypothetical protein
MGDVAIDRGHNRSGRHALRRPRVMLDDPTGPALEVLTADALAGPGGGGLPVSPPHGAVQPRRELECPDMRASRRCGNWLRQLGVLPTPPVGGQHRRQGSSRATTILVPAVEHQIRARRALSPRRLQGGEVSMTEQLDISVLEDSFDLIAERPE